MHRTTWHDALLCLIIEGGRCAFLKLLLKTSTQFVIIWMLVSLALIRMVSLALIEFLGKSAKTGTRLLRLASTGCGCRQPGRDKISKELHNGEISQLLEKWVETESGWTAPPIHYPGTAIQVQPGLSRFSNKNPHQDSITEVKIQNLGHRHTCNETRYYLTKAWTSKDVYVAV